MIYIRLTRELLDVGRLARDEGERHDARDVHLGAEHVHVEAELLADALDVLETLLVVGAGTTDPDLDVVLDERGRDFPQGADDTLEGGGDVGEVGDTTTDEEDLAVGVLGGAEHEVEDSAGVVEGLGLGRSTRIFAVVGKLTGEASRGDGVGVDDGSTATGDEGPDAAGRVEDGELERGTGLCVHLGNVGLLLAHLAAEGSRELHGRADIDGRLALLGRSDGYAKGSCAASDSPLSTALKLSSLVELGCEIEEVDLGRGGICVGDDDERIDLEVAGGISMGDGEEREALT